MLELEWIAEADSEAGVVLAVGARRRASRPLALVALGVMTGALLTGIAFWSLRTPSSPRPLARLEITLPPTDRLTNTGRSVVAVSPQGTHLV